MQQCRGLQDIARYVHTHTHTHYNSHNNCKLIFQLFDGHLKLTGSAIVWFNCRFKNLFVVTKVSDTVRARCDRGRNVPLNCSLALPGELTNKTSMSPREPFSRGRKRKFDGECNLSHQYIGSRLILSSY